MTRRSLASASSKASALPGAAAGLMGGARATLVVLAGLVTSCQSTIPALVRDEVGHFSLEARAEAQEQLEVIARERGIWIFILTERDGDPPRMLDEPMAEADAASQPAVAILVDQDNLIATGHSRAMPADSAFLEPPSIDGLIAQGHGDEALRALVRYAELWVAKPPTKPPVVNPPIEGPTGPP
jgi:hypothetical protein